MKKTDWQKLLKGSDDPSRAKQMRDSLGTSAAAQLNKLSAESGRVLLALLSGSQYLGEWLVAHPESLSIFDAGKLKYPRRAEGFLREIESQLAAKLKAGDDVGALADLRRYKQREMLRIAARDLGRLGDVVEITRELSALADVCLSVALKILQHQMRQKYGRAFHQNADGRWQPTPFCVLGLGKLGGAELNYSSDVDLIFVYGDEGEVFLGPPDGKKARRPGMSNHQFFCKLAETFTAEVSRATGDGFLFRVDLRLRPEGEGGPVARSLESYENFYAEWGQTWERMMLIKARHVAGDESLASEFLEMIQPFRYPHSINRNILAEIAGIKDRIENEVVGGGELERNVKLGRGGIREIEFIVQSLQVLHAGKTPFLQLSQTLPCLEKLAQYHLLSRDEADQIGAAYRFLRDVEHRLQMENNLQTHTLPVERAALLRLARLMGFLSADQFEAALQMHTANVRSVYDKLLKREAPSVPSGLPATFEGAETEWRRLLEAHSFREPDKAFFLFKEFAEGPGYVHVSARTTELARELIPQFLARCPVAAPTEDRHEPAFNREPARNAESDLGSHPSLSVPLAVEGRGKSDLFGPRKKTASSPLPSPPIGIGGEGDAAEADGGSNAGQIAAGPGVQGANVSGKSNSGPQTGDLPAILSDPDRVLARLDSYISAYGSRSALLELWSNNPKLYELLLLLFDRSEFLAEMSIRSPDLIDNLVLTGRFRQRKSAGEILRELRFGISDADQFLWVRRYHEVERMRIGLRDIIGLASFEQNLAELSALADGCLQYAFEAVLRKNKIKTPPFAIIGLGKLGGEEITYGSDLDLIFVTRSETGQLATLQKMAAEILALLSRRTEQGIAFQTDVRLRPDGEKGLLVQSLEGCERYYRQRAQLWEIQALSRARFVGGDSKTGECFGRLVSGLADFSAIRNRRWKRQIHEMRLRIEKERTPPGQDELAIKTGRGGLMDAEFIAQALCLEHGWHEPNTLRALERARERNLLPDTEGLVENYRQLRRVEGILRRWSYEGETVLPEDAPAYYRVSVRCGFGSPEKFREALAGWRAAIRACYAKVFPF